MGEVPLYACFVSLNVRLKGLSRICTTCDKEEEVYPATPSGACPAHVFSITQLGAQGPL